MFGRTPKVAITQLENLTERILTSMNEYGPESPEYPALLSRLEDVMKLRSSQEPQKTDRNTMALVAGNLLGILIIVAYEQKHVFTSKGLGLILKSK